MMNDFLWPSDRDRAENEELNRVCEQLEAVIDSSKSENPSPRGKLIEDYKRLKDRLENVFEDTEEVAGWLLEYAEDPDRSSVDRYNFKEIECSLSGLHGLSALLVEAIEAFFINDWIAQAPSNEQS